MATTIGRLMPSRTPAEDANERFVFKTDTVGTDYEAFYALTPQRVKSMVEQAEAFGEVGPLYNVYDRMETTDTRYGGLVKQLKAAIGGFRLKVMAASATEGEEKKIADDYAAVMREVIARLDSQSITKGFTDPHFIGARLYRLSWQLEDYAYGRKLWLPKEVAPVEGKVLRSEKDTAAGHYGKMFVRTDDSPTDGRLIERLPLGSSIFLEAEYGRDRYAKLGVARKCLPWYLGIQFVQSWWVQYIEGYGSPLRIGRHPRGVDAKARMNMERFLKVLGQHGYALFPNDMEVQLLEANRQGTITTYGDFIAKGHEEYAIAILGQADTVGSKGGGSYAKAVVSNSIRFETMQDVANLVTQGWRKLAELVMRINYGDAFNPRLLPAITPVLITPAEMQAKASAATSASAEGIQVPVSFWYEQVLGVEEPREGEKAVKYGQTYVVGTDPEPEPQQPAAPAPTDDDDDREEEDGDRSVASGGNKTYDKKTSTGK